MTVPEYRRDTPYFKYVNANPRNLKSSGDCVVRAIALATNQTWNDVYKKLCDIGLELNQMPNDNKVYEKYLEELGWAKQKQLRKPDNTKYNLIELAEMTAQANQGRGATTIVRVANHLTVISRGKILDTWNCGEKTAGNFWIYQP